MFDLEQAISQWRRQMLAAGIKAPVPLDELEIHLREEIERQIQSGLEDKRAFEIAAQQIGPARQLKAEFAKAARPSGFMEKIMILTCAVLVGFIVWLSGFTFWFIGLTPGEQVLAYSAVIFTLAVACGWRYAVPFLPVIPNKRKRSLAVFVCFVSGFLPANLVCNFVLPHFEKLSPEHIPAIGFWMILPIAIGFGLAGGIQEAARRQTATAD